MKPFSASLGIAVLGVGVIVACGSNSPSEVIVEPGITAIRESNALACSSDLQSLQLAIEAYTTLNIDPPTAESDLVPDWLRAESALYDLVEGHVVPAPGSDCPAAPDDSAAAPNATANQDPARVSECTARFKTLSVAIEAYYAMNGTSVTATEQALLDAGLVRVPDEGYDVDSGGQVVAVPGGRCHGVDVPRSTPLTTPATTSSLPEKTGECAQQRKVLEVAVAAYLAATGSPPASEADLVPSYIGSESTDYDIVDGVIASAPDSTCT